MNAEATRAYNELEAARDRQDTAARSVAIGASVQRHTLQRLADETTDSYARRTLLRLLERVAEYDAREREASEASDRFRQVL